MNIHNSLILLTKIKPPEEESIYGIEVNPLTYVRN